MTPGDARLADLGGKAANLVELRDAGFDVPEFVVIGTAEYAAFVAEHGLDATLAAALDRPAAEASEQIRVAFRRPLSAAQAERLAALVAPLLDRPVAVRSSATAEDLPEASFAGQQDTFLDVRGLDAILAAVVECWSSLWTERAITYRARNAVPTEAIGLAVVVQELVDAEASGVLFTADPLTGHRGRTVVDAVFGLGEELVSGRVTPDHFEVDTATGAVHARTIQGDAPTLTDPQLAALVDLGRRIAAHYGQPQDIEWTRVGDRLRVVQSRAITSLFPLPDAAGPDLPLWLSFGGFQGMLEPITPLGADILRRMLSGAAALFGHAVDHRTNPYVRPAGERLWMRADKLLRAVPAISLRGLPVVDPAAASVVAHLAGEPAFAPRPSRAGRLAAARLGLPVAAYLAPRIARNFADPDAARGRFNAFVEELIGRFAGHLDAAGAVARPEQRLRARVQVIESVLEQALRTLLPIFAPIMGPSIAMIQRLRGLAAQTRLPDADALALTILRSLPDNVTTAMDLALYDVAKAVRDDAASLAVFRATDPAALSGAYLAGTLPPVAQDALAGFLGRFGMRGVAEIDIGTPRWRDRPEAVLRTVVGYLDLPPDAAPDAAHARGAAEARAAVEKLAGALPGAKARQVRFLASRLRGLFGLRETPKFTLVRMLGLTRPALLASGADLVAAGRLDAPDDVFLLTLDELRVAFAHDQRGAVAERRASRERELRRTRVPIAMVGDGRTFYSGMADPDAAADLAGTGVSPGVVEGAVRVVRDPRTSELRPGEIMVCRGTDPAWTPLFLTAGGLITEVGGLMTHGSVVAREYGLPAVVGVGEATTRLASGQRIRLDGTAGTITLLEPSAE